jgi:hypothetical protein
MAARRLLIVMLVLLGLSTLAAALVPQRTLRDGGTTGTTTTQATATAPAPQSAPNRSLTAKVVVGSKKFPVVASPVCKARKPRCAPIHVGDQLSLVVRAKAGVQLSLPEFGQFAFAGPEAPAHFELLMSTPGKFGILFADPGDVPICKKAVGKGSPCVAARIEVLTPAAARKAVAPPARSRARAGSG